MAVAKLGRAERLSHLLPIRMSWHGERKFGHGYGVRPAKRPIVLRRLVENMHGEDALDRGGQNLFLFYARFRFPCPLQGSLRNYVPFFRFFLSFPCGFLFPG